MIVISIINRKGGVGKTTSSIHIGSVLSNRKTKVLLIDFDTQINLTTGLFGREPYTYTVKNFLEGTGEFKIRQKEEGLYVLAGDKDLRSSKFNKNILKKQLKTLQKFLKIDYVIIDCPANPLIGEVYSLGEIALVASDFLLCPVLPEEYSMIGIDDMIPVITGIRQRENQNLKILGFFFTRVLINTTRLKNYQKKIKESSIGKHFLNTVIRQDENIEKAKAKRKTIIALNPSSRASKDFIKLGKEIKAKIKSIV